MDYYTYMNVYDSNIDDAIDDSKQQYIQCFYWETEENNSTQNSFALIFSFSLNKIFFYKSKQSVVQADGYAAILNEELQNIVYFI